MQVLTISELKELIEEYRAAGISTEDLEKRLESLKKGSLVEEVIAPSSPIVKKNADGSYTVTYSTGPIEPEISKKLRKPCHK